MNEQKLIFVTGKGGVGKSTVALAIARNLSQNKRVLLVELGLRSFYADSFKTPVKYHPQDFEPNLDLAMWSGSECLKEYALHLLKVESLYNLFFENRISRALIDVAPALSELAILGKITSGIRQVGPPLNYDVIIIDSYATGHMLALLRAPRGMAEAVKFGPMAEQTGTMLATIRNPNLCEFVIVTLPEELPAVEGDELYREIKNETGIEPSMICNKVWPANEINGLPTNETLTPQDQEASFINELRDLSNRQEGWVHYLSHRHPNLKVLPMVFSSEFSEIVGSLQKELT